MVSEKTELNRYVEALCAEVRSEYTIDPRYYEGSAVKQGLRNADGTGVIAGVTRIGSVQGYLMRDMEKIPIPGELFYRGISVSEIVKPTPMPRPSAAASMGPCLEANISARPNTMQLTTMSGR